MGFYGQGIELAYENNIDFLFESINNIDFEVEENVISEGFSIKSVFEIIRKIIESVIKAIKTIKDKIIKTVRKVFIKDGKKEAEKAEKNVKEFEKEAKGFSDEDMSKMKEAILKNIPKQASEEERKETEEKLKKSGFYDIMRKFNAEKRNQYFLFAFSKKLFDPNCEVFNYKLPDNINDLIDDKFNTHYLENFKTVCFSDNLANHIHFGEKTADIKKRNENEIYSYGGEAAHANQSVLINEIKQIIKVKLKEESGTNSKEKVLTPHYGIFHFPYEPGFLDFPELSKKYFDEVEKQTVLYENILSKLQKVSDKGVKLFKDNNTDIDKLKANKQSTDAEWALYKVKVMYQIIMLNIKIINVFLEMDAKGVRATTMMLKRYNMASK